MSVIIPINEQYRIELDNFNWTVAKWKNRSNNPDGGIWVGETYHRTLQQAGERLLRLLVCESNLSGAQEICDALKQASMLIARAIAESELSDSWLAMKETEKHQVRL